MREVGGLVRVDGRVVDPGDVVEAVGDVLDHVLGELGVGPDVRVARAVVVRVVVVVVRRRLVGGLVGIRSSCSCSSVADSSMPVLASMSSPSNPEALHRVIEPALEPGAVDDERVGFGEREQLRGRGIEAVGALAGGEQLGDRRRCRRRARA